MATKGEIREYFAKFGRQGGKATARNRTPEERSEAARKAVRARWDAQTKRIKEDLAEIQRNLKKVERRPPGTKKAL